MGTSPRGTHPAAVVFDMDGTLLDSETLARAYFEQACLDVYQAVDMRVYDRCVGTTWEVTEALMRESFGPAFPFEVVDRRWSQLYRTHIAQTPVAIKPGILLLLKLLRELNIPLAVATSSRRPEVETKLRMAAIDQYFEFTVCGGETDQGKPHPAPYLAATAALGCLPAQCWALEDSDNGVRSAMAAGLTVFQIPDALPPSEEALGLGQKILESAVDLLPRLV